MGKIIAAYLHCSKFKMPLKAKVGILVRVTSPKMPIIVALMVLISLILFSTQMIYNGPPVENIPEKKPAKIPRPKILVFPRFDSRLPRREYNTYASIKAPSIFFKKNGLEYERTKTPKTTPTIDVMERSRIVFLSMKTHSL